MTDRPSPILFALPGHEAMVESLSALVPGSAIGVVERRTFPDGERYLRVHTPVDGSDAVLVGGTVDDGATLDLYDLSCALVGFGAASLRLVVPWFGHATMERAVKPGEVVMAKTRARLLSAIPPARGGNRIALVDIHADGIPYYFEGGMRPTHLWATDVVQEMIRLAAGASFASRSCVLGGTDAGRAKWVGSLADRLRMPSAAILKRRGDDGETEVMAVGAEVRGRDVMIYDDMIRTGGSLLAAARVYRDAGARRIVAIATHGVFPGDTIDRLRVSGLIEGVWCTDTHPRAAALGDDPFVHVLPIAPIIARWLVDPTEIP